MSTTSIAEKVKFTPGPWVLDKPEPLRSDSIDIHNATGELWLFSVMGSHVGPQDSEETIANAKLIASAPDMYDIIKELYDWSIRNNTKGAIFPKLEAVINKINQ